jgi:hypothetical protein
VLPWATAASSVQVPKPRYRTRPSSSAHVPGVSEFVDAAPSMMHWSPPVATPVMVTTPVAVTVHPTLPAPVLNVIVPALLVLA